MQIKGDVMKKYLALAALALFAGLSSLPLRADDMSEGSKKREKKLSERSEKRLQNLTKKLGLSAEQQSSVKTALDAEKTKMADLHKETGEKMKALRDDTNSQIKAVLTDDQKAKFEAFLAEQKKNWKEYKHDQKEDSSTPTK